MHCIELDDNVRDLAEDLVCWFLREYIPKGLFFLVLQEKDLSGEGVSGWCMRETQNEFLIQIDQNIDDDYTYKRVLLHELWHMYQYYNDLPRDEDETLKQEWTLLDKYHENE